MKILTALLCTLALGACSNKPPEPKAEVAGASTIAAAPRGLDPVTANQQRALEVQKSLEMEARRHGEQLPPIDSSQPQKPTQQ